MINSLELEEKGREWDDAVAWQRSRSLTREWGVEGRGDALEKQVQTQLHSLASGNGVELAAAAAAAFVSHCYTL